jgi:phosphoribosyl-ATP pyrophosphohydrolase
MAAKDGEKEKIIYEVADLWFHTLVLLRHKDIEIAKIEEELSNNIYPIVLIQFLKKTRFSTSVASDTANLFYFPMFFLRKKNHIYFFSTCTVHVMLSFYICDNM